MKVLNSPVISTFIVAVPFPRITIFFPFPNRYSTISRKHWERLGLDDLPVAPFFAFSFRHTDTFFSGLSESHLDISIPLYFPSSSCFILSYFGIVVDRQIHDRNLSNQMRSIALHTYLCRRRLFQRRSIKAVADV